MLLDEQLGRVSGASSLHQGSREAIMHSACIGNRDCIVKHLHVSRMAW